MELTDLTMKQLQDALKELEDAQRCLSQNTDAARARYEHALAEVDTAYRAHERAERRQGWHTPGSTAASL